jgi:lipoprotein signal peptidase
MVWLILFMLAVPLMDHWVKAWLRQSLGSRVVPLGMLGSVRVVDGRIWMVKLHRGFGRMHLWSIWIACAVALMSAVLLLPGAGPYAGLLLGGALSHAIEVTRRGAVCDYICLRFWPAFNLADVAITIGGFGLVWCLALALKGGLP